MEAPLSVVVASRGRPAALLLCLEALRQSDHPEVEIIVVACPAGAAALRQAGQDASLKLTVFDAANLSAARNMGILRAAAPVVAFIDDDALAEPTWASRLTAPFADSSVAAAGGFVRGRNGIAFQWRAMTVDATGADHPLEVPVDRTTVQTGDAERAVKTQGTCCAFRRDTLARAGGFDPALRFFLDEADVNLRLAAAGHRTAIVPDAQVVHGFAASDRRRSDRVPTDLFEIGASLAVFLRRHAEPERHAAAMDRFRAEQRRRMLRHMVDGRLSPGDVRPVLATLEAGFADGLARPLPPLAPLGPCDDPFRPLPGTGRRDGRMIVSLPGNRAAAEAEARAARKAGAVVTVLHLSPGRARHRLWMRPDGIWEQRGGTWGRSDPADPPVRPWRPADRAARERARLAATRPVAPLEP